MLNSLLIVTNKDNTIIHMDLASAGDSSSTASSSAFGFPTHLVSAAVNVLDGGSGGGPGSSHAIIYEPTAALPTIGGE